MEVLLELVAPDPAAAAGAFGTSAVYSLAEVLEELADARRGRDDPVRLASI